MKSNRIKVIIVSIMLMALAGMIFPGSSVIAGEKMHTSKCCCICTACTNDLYSISTDDSTRNGCKCGCTISPAPESNEQPMVIPVTSRQFDVDGIVAVQPDQVDITDHPQYTQLFINEQPAYDYLSASSPDGRAPPV